MFRTGTHKDIATSLEMIGAPVAIFESKQQKTDSLVLVSANSLFEEITAKPILECIGIPLSRLLPRYIEKQMHISFGLCLAKQHPQETEVVIEREGASRWWRFLVSPITLDDCDIQRMIVTLTEITEKKLLEQKLEVAKQRFSAIVETAYDGIITIDQNQTVMMMNQAARDMFLVAEDTEAVGHLQRFIPQRFWDKHSQYIDSFRKSAITIRPMQSRSPICGLRTDGSEIPIEVTISKIKVGNEIEMTAVIQDVSERTKLIEQLKEISTRDPLTEIFNRRHGTTVLSSEIHRCQRFSRALTVAMFDLDRFKAINDTCGHPSGDFVLKSVVATVSKTLRDTDTFCRWGGDEFLVLLPETTPDKALIWAERVRETVASQTIIGFGGQSFRVSASFGLAAMGRKDSTPEGLLKRVDEALYHAKERGGNEVVVAT